MNRTEHLYTKLAEEGIEVGHRTMKLLHFGPNEVEPGQTRTNLERLRWEVDDFLAMVVMLEMETLLPEISDEEAQRRAKLKQRKVEKFLEYSMQLGCTTVSE